MLTTEKRIELLKALAHPARIKILEELVEGVKCVSDFEETLDSWSWSSSASTDTTGASHGGSASTVSGGSPVNERATG